MLCTAWAKNTEMEVAVFERKFNFTAANEAVGHFNAPIKVLFVAFFDREPS